MTCFRIFMTMVMLALGTVAEAKQCRISAKSMRINLANGDVKVRGHYDPHSAAAQMFDEVSWEDCYERALSSLYDLSMHRPYQYTLGYCELDLTNNEDEVIDASVCINPVYQVYPFVYWNYDDMIGPFGNSWGYVNVFTESFSEMPQKRDQRYTSRGEPVNQWRKTLK